MAETATREDIATLARQAGLDLPPEYFEQLVSAYGNICELVAALPRNRPRGDEPAHVFVAEKFLPEAS